jgi:hypothetical protein
MIKRMLLAVAVVGGTMVAAAPETDAGVFVRRVAPVRRVVYPPYPVARRVAAPVYAPVVYPAYRPVIYGGPGVYGRGFYGPGVSVGVGVY